MKKHFIKVLSFVLTLVMILSTVTIAFAKDSTDPVILVHGLGAVSVYEDASQPTRREIENLGIGPIGDVATKLLREPELLFQVIKMLDPAKKVSEDKLIKEIAKLVSNSKLNCTKDGNIPAGQGIGSFYTDSLANHKDYWENATANEPAIARQLCKTAGAKNVYLFKYDWRQDICKTADDLNQYIKDVKKKTGAKKVTVVGCSLGGSVLAAYLDKYMNNNDVKRCLFVNPAFQGVDVARAYAKDLAIDSKTVIAYLNNLKTTLYGGQYKTLIQIGLAVGDVRIKYAADYLNKFLKNKNNVNRLYNEVLKDWIGNIPSLWECIPYDSYDKAVKEMSAIGFLDKSSGLYKKISNYHKVQGRLKSNLKKAKKKGIEIAIFADYGTMGIPVTSKAKNQTDILIDTKYASAGATTAKVGSKLSASGKYVSSDKAINAKTCALPDNTWFIKNKQHMAFAADSKATKLLANIACGKVKCNVSAVKKKYGYNQFVKADQAQNLSNKL